MPNFLWTAKDKFGEPVVKEVTADTIEQSKAILLAEGCTELRLKTDEITDATIAAFPKKMKIFGKDIDATVPSEERLKYLDNLSQTTLRQIFERVMRDKMIYLFGIALLVIVVLRGQITFAIAIGVAIIGWLAFSIRMALPGIYYDKMDKATDWHRWTEVLELVNISRRIRQKHIVKMPEWKLMKLRAQALAGLGKLAEALEEFTSCENQPGMPSWLYKTVMANIYDIAKQHDKAVEYITEAIAEEPTPALYLDLIFHLLHYKKDATKASEVLSTIEKNAITGIAEPFHLRCLGILAYLEADYASAKQQLESSLEIFERKNRWPFRDGHISLTKSYLCRTLAKQGDLTAAKKYFAEARKYLAATDQVELLDECKKAVGE